MVTSDDLGAIATTLQLALVTCAVLLIIATPVAWWLAWTQSRWRVVVAAVTALPLVLPPTVLGFYLLLWMAPDGALGTLARVLGAESLAFTFAGLIIGSCVFSLPFAVLPLQFAFESIGRRPMEVAACLRASPWDAFWSVAVPQARSGWIAALILVFAHTVGEFGVVLMIGGNVPGSTRVVSTQLYNHVEAMEYPAAHALAAVMVVFSFLVLIALIATGRRRLAMRP